MRILTAILLLAGAAWPADTGFNGRWDIAVEHAPRGRAWWLQVEGAGTSHIKGKFVGFPGGDLNDVQHIWIDNGELRGEARAAQAHVVPLRRAESGARWR